MEGKSKMPVVSPGPLDPASNFYMHRQLDDALLQSLTRGEYINLRGGRQTGKTSLIWRMRKKLQELSAVTAYVDAAAILETDAEQQSWLEAFAKALQSMLLPDDLRTSMPHAPKTVVVFPDYLYEIIRAIKPHKQLIIFVDEVTAVPDLVRYPFFRILRHVYNQRTAPGGARESKGIQFVFAGTFDPERLMIGKNSPFNIATDFETAMYDLSLEQVIEQAIKFGVADHGEAVFNWTSGHPWLTNRLLALVAECQAIERAVQMLMNDDPNLRQLGAYLRDVGDGARKLAQRIRLGATIPYNQGMSEAFDDLMVMGLVKPDAVGNAVVRCHIYSVFLERLQQFEG
jgi:hypothetical protein